MADRILQILITAKDQATKELDKMKSSLESNKEAFQNVAKAGAIAMGAISAVAIKSISDYGEAQKSAKQLEHAVLQVSHATQEQLDQTNELADALERKGVLDGDNIRMGLAQLSTFGLSNKAVQGLGNSLADLAVNQFGVSASGDQMADTANMIAKALNGQFGVLEKSGIRFNEAQRKAIEFGTEMEKVNAINEGFAQNLKYTNDVALQTFEGQLAKVQVQLGNVSENIGKALLPLVERLMTAIIPVVDKMVQWTNDNPQLAQNILLIGGALAGLLTVVGTLGLVLPSIISGFVMLGSAIAFIFSPIGLIILAIGGLIALGVMLYKHWDEVSAKATEVWGNIANFFTNIWNVITGALTTAWNSIASFFKSIWDGIVAVFQFAVALIAGLVIAVFNAMGVDIFAVFEVIKSNIKLALDFISFIFTTTFTFLTTAWTNFWNFIGAFITPIWEKIKTAVSSGWNFIKNIFATASKPVADGWINLWTGVGNSLTMVWEGIKNTIKSGINWVLDKINFVIRKANEVAQMGAVVGFTPPRIPEIPMLAKGGIVTKPTIAMIGEAGAEAVVPLNKANGLGGGITIIVNGDVSGQDLIDKVSNAIMGNLRNNAQVAF